MRNSITENEIETIALSYLQNLEYEYVLGTDIAPDGEHPERQYSEVVLITRLRDAIDKLTIGEKISAYSERKNIVVIADEAHRSQYDFIDGFARKLRDALPNATFIGFTGTPIESSDRNTQAVFGNYVDIYDIQQAVEYKATVPIFYESRLAKVNFAEEEKVHLDEQFINRAQQHNNRLDNQRKCAGNLTPKYSPYFAKIRLSARFTGKSG